MSDTLSIRELELSIMATNTIERAFPGCTIGELRGLMSVDNSALHKKLRVRDIKQIRECLTNVPPTKPGLFDHINFDVIRTEREQTGGGVQTILRKMQREALIAHLDSDDELELRVILRWLVERAQ